ncbi:MAG: anthranilate synthase component I [Vulcanimicrobiota bacterium]
MNLPTLEDFRGLAGPGRVIPLYRELPADLETPLSVYLKLRSDKPSFLFESVERGEETGRYSFLGTAPETLLRVEAGQEGEDSFELIRSAIARFEAVNLPGLPSFWGGAVGYLGYDAVRKVETIGQAPPDDVGLPEALFVQCRHSVAFDHVLQKMFVVVAIETSTDAEADYARGCAELEGLVRRLQRALDYQPPGGPSNGYQPEEAFNRTEADYMQAVEQAKEYIRAGDIFQLVLSQRYRRATWTDAVSIYRALRILNPSPYMFLLDLGEFQLVGSSPEMLVKLEGDLAETRPIAGTRPRGKSEQEDAALAQDLLADPKERAEHVMLVDLGRNDLGRVCRYGTVEVPHFMEVERYSHVMHLVSKVYGRLREGLTGIDLARACFPAGTVSGAPKIRAMQLIDELEPTRRGPYAGAVGYFSYWGAVDTCITIRTLVMKDGYVYLQAGAGIVADSDPAAEYRETLAKLAALRQAVELAEGDLLR